MYIFCKLYLPILSLGGILALNTACEELSPLEGTVIAEKYHIPRIISKDDSVFSNETIQLGEPTYSFNMKTNEGKLYTVSVREGDITLDAIDLAVDVGTRVKLDYHPDHPPNKGKNIIKISSNEIKMLE